MTLDPATVTVPVASGVATVNWSLPAGATQTYYRIEIHREDDVPAGGGATHNPVGGTRRVFQLEPDARVRGDWISSGTARSMRVNSLYPSEAYLGNGTFVCRMWWRGQQPGILGNDIESRAADVTFTVAGSPYPAVIPNRLVRRRLESGQRVRVDVFPAPRIVAPTELQQIPLADDAHLNFEFDVPARLVQQIRYFKLGFYAEEVVLSPRHKTNRPSVLSDDGLKGQATFAEWVPIGLAADRISGAPAGWQRYRTVIAPHNYYSANATRQSQSLLDVRLWSAHIRYGDNREGNYRSSEVDNVVFEITQSNAPATQAAAIKYDTPVFLTKPVLEAANPNPVFIDQGEDWFINFVFINENGLAQQRIQVQYQGDGAKATALGSGATGSSYMLWRANEDGTARFDTFTTDESAVMAQPLPVPAHDSDTLTRAPNTRVGLTEAHPGGLERRYFNFIGQASDGRLTGGTSGSTLWSEPTNGTNENPQPLRVYLYRRLRVSRLAVVTPVAMPLNQREPTYANGRATNGFVSLEADIAHATLTHQQDTGNWPAEIKVGWYRQEDIQGGVPVAAPFAYTSDYRIRPGAEQTLEQAVSRTGAEWVPTSNALSATAGTNHYQAVRDNGDFPLRWGEYVAQGGNIDSLTYGGIPNGTWVVRADMRDPQGGRATAIASATVTINLPAVRDVLAAPRIYDINHNVATTGPLNDEVTSGFAPGAYIGLGFTEVADSTKGLVSYIEIERRETDAANNPVAGTHVRLPGRLRPDSSGIFPIYRDYLLQVDKLYQYRCRAVRNPGTEAYSDWRPN